MNELDLFADAIAIANPNDRSAFLDRKCVNRPDLRQRLVQLLEAHANSRAMLDRPTRDPDATAAHETNVAHIGTIIAGRYKLLEQIGDGGMGTVWMAEQQKPVKRLVAVKLIKAGMDSKAILARFDAERQALALMDHPNIAKVLDGGTTEEGYPFFVMELVKGLPLTEYCDSRKLSVSDRLNLFVQICSAVQHAHQKAVIHRDLKPSNILVTEHDGKPVPKVIDFGLAKALSSSNKLTERTLHTAYGAVVGTPLYMAPELVGINALDVDTRADIYALGVILYELLTGTTPLEKARFKEAAWDEIKRVIREEEPPKPSTRLSSDKTLASLAASRQVEPAQLQRLIRGELDWIVMKALDKDRARRYETANGLAKDIQRYLSGDTVEACPPTLGYRLRKVYRRNRGAILTAGAFVLLLACGLAATSYGLFQANTERRRAEGAERSVRDVTQQAQEASRELVQVKANIEREQAHLGKLKYARTLHFADTALQTNKFDVARKELDQASPEQRGWEWHYLHRQWRSDYLMELKPRHNDVNNVSYSPDGRWIVTGSSTSVNNVWIGTVQVWNATTGQLLFTLTDNLPMFRSVSFNHDGQQIMTVQDSGVKLWNVGTKALDWQLEPEPGMTCRGAQLARDGARLVMNSIAVRDTSPDWFLKRSITVWDTATRKPVWPSRHWVNHVVSSASFCQDGQWIIFSVSTRTKTPVDDQSGTKARYWDSTDVHVLEASSGKTVLHLPTSTHSSTRVNTIQLNATADRLLTCDFEGRAMLWPVKKVGDSLVRQGDPISLAGQAIQAIFSPDGKHLVASEGFNRDRGIRIWEVDRGIETRLLKGHSEVIWGLAYSPDGTRIATAGNDGTVKVWDALTKQEPPFRHPRILDITYSPRGDLLLTSNESESKVWNTSTGKEHCPPLKGGCQWHNGHPRFSPDGRWIAIIDNNTIRIHDTTTFAIKHTLTEPTGEVNVVSFNHDGSQLLVASNYWTVKVWDIARGVALEQIGTPSTLKGYTNAIYSPSGEQFFIEHLGKDALTMTGITLYDARTRAPKLKLEMDTIVYEHWNGAFTADGKRFIGYFMFKDKPCECRVWNTATGKLESTFKTYKGINCHMTISPDGKRLITIGDQAAAKVWDLDTGLELISIPVNYQVNTVAFHPDGSKFALGHGLQDVLLIDGTPLPELKQ
jgi:serine/threonine protein kinase/WD40 repeat protein